MFQICDDKLLILHLLLLLMSACETSEILTFTGHERGKVEIHCPYESKYKEDKKYLCRGDCPRVVKDKVVESESAAQDQRFSLIDNKTAQIFTVTITDLRTDDQAKYWCGVKTGFGNYDYNREIYLEIKHVSRASAVTGERHNISCRYESELKNDVKFICKESSLSLCEKSAIKVSSEANSNGRFSLRDDESTRVFTVTISDLREEDSGIYWCGAGQRGEEHKNKWISVTELNVSAVTSERTSSKPTATTASFHTSKPVTADTASNSTITSSPLSSSSSSSSTLVLKSESAKPQEVIVVLVIVLLTGLALLLFIYLRWKQKKEGTQPKDVAHGPTTNPPDGETREATHTDCDYEDLSSTLDHPDYSLVLPAFAEHDSSVYALAQLSSSLSDDLSYSSIRFTATRLSDRTSPEEETYYTTVRP